MPECQDCGNRRVFSKQAVVEYTVEYDEQHGEVEWESDEYEFHGPNGDDYLTCGDCGSNTITHE